ncbi:1-deoxy-D-xylulose-5-phosphate synthase [candidate division KSB1 bacterium]|nr:1-deoxy-D-xylulose-5-phosphate synthase [candidate division KSB1 bacterium]
MYDVLNKIQSPADLKHLDIPQLAALAKELREFVISTISKTGGHLAPSLGVVELTLALHYIFNAPKDKIIWDVGHQAYIHKILTGRKSQFHTIRQYKGLSGFPKIDESDYDHFGVGHASTAISAALGIACARDLNEEDYSVIAVVGDGALSGGVALEGLNNAGAQMKNLIVVLNDNTMSISKNVGALSKYLTNLITHPTYNLLKNDVWDLTGKLSGFGDRLRSIVSRIEKGVKAIIVPGLVFEQLGYRYIGPIDGHNLAGLVRVFKEIKKMNGPILLHIMTVKGKGYKLAEEDASKFHGLGSFDRQTGKVNKTSENPTYTRIFSDTIVEIAEKNPKIIGITAAMSIGTGLAKFMEIFPERSFDVGIAEQHAVTFAAGLATQGYHPVVAIYSSFLQRAYDQIIHDVALQNLPVIFCLDRAGLVGDDGPTHHGAFDLSYLRHIPNLVAMAPKDEDELKNMLWTASRYTAGPIAIRYPRGQGEGVILSETAKSLPIGKAEILRKGKDVAVLAIGNMVHPSLRAANRLKAEGISAQVVNMRFLKPLDEALLEKIGKQFSFIVTVEDNVRKGGFGSGIVEFFADKQNRKLAFLRLGLPDKFIEHGERDILYHELNLDEDGIFDAILKFYQTNRNGKNLSSNKEYVYENLELTADTMR